MRWEPESGGRELVLLHAEERRMVAEEEHQRAPRSRKAQCYREKCVMLYPNDCVEVGFWRVFLARGNFVANQNHLALPKMAIAPLWAC